MTGISWFRACVPLSTEGIILIYTICGIYSSLGIIIDCPHIGKTLRIDVEPFILFHRITRKPFGVYFASILYKSFIPITDSK